MEELAMPAGPREDHQSHDVGGNAIYALVERLQHSWSTGCGKELAAIFDDDVAYTAWNGIYLYGRAAVIQNYRRMFGANEVPRTLRLDVVNIRFLSDDIAAVHVAAHLGLPLCDDASSASSTKADSASFAPFDSSHAVTTRNQPPLSQEYAALLILCRRRRQWRCAVFHNTLVRSSAGR